MLGRELGRGRDLDLLDIAERALGEGREPAQRFDLDVEHVDAHRPLLGRREDVEQAAPHGELAALFDLVDALVSGADELLGALIQVEQLADPQRERVRAAARIGDLLRQRDRADYDDGPVRAGARAGASSASSAATRSPTRCGRRSEMRLVGDAPGRVVADAPGREPRAKVGRQVAGGPIVADDHQRGARASRLSSSASAAIRYGRSEHETKAWPPSRASLSLGSSSSTSPSSEEARPPLRPSSRPALRAAPIAPSTSSAARPTSSATWAGPSGSARAPMPRRSRDPSSRAVRRPP